MLKTKKCNKCYVIKDIINFYKKGHSKDGYANECIECKKQIDKTYYLKNYDKLKILRDANKPRIKELFKRWSELNKDKRELYRKEYRAKNGELIRQKSRERYADNIEESRAVNREKYKNNSEHMRKLAKQWRENNLEKAKEISRKTKQKNRVKIAAHKKVYRQKNKEKLNAWSNDYQKCRRQKDIKYKLNGNMSNVIGRALRGNKNGWHWEDIVGYTLKDLMTHLEKRFTKEMSWKNHGIHGWHIDHIIPKSLWKFKNFTDREFRQCWSLCNLQPLWAMDNLNKGKKT